MNQFSQKDLSTSADISAADAGNVNPLPWLREGGRVQAKPGAGPTVDTEPRVPAQPTRGSTKGNMKSWFVFIKGFTVFKAKY